MYNPYDLILESLMRDYMRDYLFKRAAATMIPSPEAARALIEFFELAGIPMGPAIAAAVRAGVKPYLAVTRPYTAAGRWLARLQRAAPYFGGATAGLGVGLGGYFLGRGIERRRRRLRGL